MINPLNLLPHEVAELVEDAEEVADLFERAAYVRRSIVIVDGDGAVFEIDVESMGRWSASLRRLVRMVETE